jgi:hypothetical protein
MLWPHVKKEELNHTWTEIRGKGNLELETVSVSQVPSIDVKRGEERKKG